MLSLIVSIYNAHKAISNVDKSKQNNEKKERFFVSNIYRHTRMPARCVYSFSSSYRLCVFVARCLPFDLSLFSWHFSCDEKRMTLIKKKTSIFFSPFHSLWQAHPSIWRRSDFYALMIRKMHENKIARLALSVYQTWRCFFGLCWTPVFIWNSNVEWCSKIEKMKIKRKNRKITVIW